MSRKWVEDINYNILIDNQHWTKLPPTIDPAIPAGEPHQQYRLNLSENALMNLFQNPFVKSERLLFKDYYNLSIAEAAEYFHERIDTIPVEDPAVPNYQQDAYTIARIATAKAHLLRARDDARKDEPNAKMKDLYLESFRTSDLLNVVAEFEAFQRALIWICIPFLKLPKDGNGFRPTEADLDIHLNGGMVDGHICAGFGDLDYHGILFKHHRTRHNADIHNDAWKFARCKGFFDNESVWERWKREQVGGPIPPVTGNACFVDQKDLNRITGGGNGYKCYTNPRRCEPGVPADYCVNNGSSYC